MTPVARGEHRAGSRRLTGLQRGVLAVALLAVSSCLALVTAEFAVRWMYSDITTTSDNTSYFALRWRERSPPDTNYAGFREREFDPEPVEGVYRIAVVGDSFAYGQGIAEEDRFSNRLDQKLNRDARERRFEVLNFALPGTETVDHVKILREHVLPARPHMVILQWFVNDAENGDYEGRPQFVRLIPSDRISAWLHRSSALYYLIARQWERWQGVLGLGADYSYNDYMTRRFAGEGGPDASRADEAVREFIRIARQNGISVGIVLFPQLSEDLKDGYALGFLVDRVLAVCASEAVNCVDLRSTFAQVTPVSRLWVNRFDPHPGRLAQELAAERLIDTYSPLWMGEGGAR